MGILGSAIGGALGIGATIYGGRKASKAMKEVQRNIQTQMKENQDWYDSRYHEDATQRADAQAVLTKTAEGIAQRNRQAAGTAAVTGGTEESVAATKAANAQAMSDAASQIAVAADNRKDQIESQYMQTKSDLNGQLNNLTEAKAKNTVTGDSYVGATKSGKAVTLAAKTQAVSSASATAKGLAESSDVKTYVDAQVKTVDDKVETISGNYLTAAAASETEYGEWDTLVAS